MLEVYSQQRPGRPRWALVASVLLLLATVGLAAALIRYKTGGDPVALRLFEAPGGLAGQLPADWAELTEGAPEDTIIAVAEPSKAGQPGRRLYIYATRPTLRATSLKQYLHDATLNYAMNVISSVGTSSGEISEQDVGAASNGQIGNLPAITVAIRHEPRRGGPAWVCAARATIAGGHVLGVAVLSPDRADFRLLERVSRALVPPSVRPGLPAFDGSPGTPAGLPARFFHDWSDQ